MNDNRETFRAILNNKQLREELERTNPEVIQQMCGFLLSTWFPTRTPQKIWMACEVVLAVGGFMLGYRWMLFILIFTLASSPRLMGELMVVLRSIGPKQRQ